MSSTARRKEKEQEDLARWECQEQEQREANSRRERLIASIHRELTSSNIETVLSDILLDPQSFIMIHAA